MIIFSYIYKNNENHLKPSQSKVFFLEIFAFSFRL